MMATFIFTLTSEKSISFFSKKFCEQNCVEKSEQNFSLNACNNLLDCEHLFRSKRKFFSKSLNQLKVLTQQQHNSCNRTAYTGSKE